MRVHADIALQHLVAVGGRDVDAHGIGGQKRLDRLDHREGRALSFSHDERARERARTFFPCAPAAARATLERARTRARSYIGIARARTRARAPSHI